MKRLLITVLVLGTILSVGLFVLSLYDRYFPYGRMWETPGIRPYETVLPVTLDSSVPFSGGEVEYREAEGDDLVSPLKNETVSRQIQEGQKLYLTYCAQCHGKNHDGNGTVGQSFNPLPANLKSNPVQTMPQGLLFQRISYGNPPNGRQPALASTIDFNDRWKIVAFVQSLGENEAAGQ